MTQYRSKTPVEAFQWTPGCELPEWFITSYADINAYSNGTWLSYQKEYSQLNDGDFIIKDNGLYGIFSLSPADFAERYEAVK